MTGSSMSSIQTLAKPLNISNSVTIQLTKRSGVVYTPTNSVASAKMSVKTSLKQVNVSKAPTPSRSFATITFRKTAIRRSPITKLYDLSNLKRLIPTALVLPLAATAFATQAMLSPRLLHCILSSLYWTASCTEKTPSMSSLTCLTYISRTL